MRSILCAAALVSLCSVGRADRIYIEAGSMTLFTATNTVEVQLWFLSPPEFQSVANDGYAMVSGTLPPRGGLLEYFTIDNSTGGGRTSEDFTIRHYLGNRETNMGLMNYAMDGRLLTATIPFERLGLSEVPFNWNAYGWGNDEPIGGPLAINDRVLHTPEPSSVALVSLGVLCSMVHLCRSRRPRLRKSGRERHIGREANRVNRQPEIA